MCDHSESIITIINDERMIVYCPTCKDGYIRSRIIINRPDDRQLMEMPAWALCKSI